MAKRIVCLALVLALGMGLPPFGLVSTALAAAPAAQAGGAAAQEDAAAQNAGTALFDPDTDLPDADTAGADADTGAADNDTAPDAPGADDAADAQDAADDLQTERVRPVANVVIFARLAGDANDDFNAAGSAESILRQYEESDTSFAAYIDAVSGGWMQVENIFPQMDETGHIDVLTIPGDADTDGVALVGEVVRALAEAGEGDALYLDAEKYQLDSLQEGVLDNLTVVLQGGSFGSRNGSFSAHYGGEETLPGGLAVSGYNALPSRVLIDWTKEDGTREKGGQSGPATLAYEFLRTLGLPEQHWRSQNGVPVGSWDLMGTAAYVPQYLLGYQRRQLGWLDADEVQTITDSGDYTLAAADEAGGVKLLVLQTDASDETICLEYRRKAAGDAFENGVYESGLIAYRAVQSGASPLENELYVYRPGETTPNGADGLNENGRNCVENAALSVEGAAYGSTDLAAGVEQNTMYYSDGSNSGLRVSGLAFSADGKTVTIHIDLAGEADGAPEEGPDGPDAGANGILGEDANSVPDDGTNSLPNDGTNSVPDDSANSVPDDSANSVPDDSANSVPDDGTNSTPDDSANSTPSDGANSVPNGGANGTPDDGANSLPSDGSDSAPDGETGDAPDADVSGVSEEETTSAPEAEPQILLHLTPPEGYTDLHIYVDGIAYDAAAEEGGIVAQLPDATGKLATMYFYNENGVPKGMYVWRLSFEGTACTATPLPGLQNLFSYHGFSIRVQSPAGIRFKSGIDTALRAAITTDGVEGYRLTEYGTMSIAANNLAQYAFVKNGEKVRSGRSYWTENGTLNDRVIETVDGRYRFASVLTGVPDRQIASQIAFRAYAVLVDGAGEEVVVYGPSVARSIYTVAQQVAAAGEFAAGSSGYDYVQGLTAAGAPGWHTADGQTYYIGEGSGLFTGVQQVDGKTYLFDAEGNRQTGWQTLDGKRCYFDAATGERFFGTGWQTIEGLQYYLDADGFAHLGDTEIDGVVWHLDPATGATYPNGWNTIGDHIFYYEYGTYLKNGLYEINKKLCHFTAEGYYVEPPVINNVLHTSSGQTATVTVTATASALTSLHAQAYSWDGGTTWTNQASQQFPVDTKLAAGTVQVRDALGNVSVYGSELTLTASGPYMGIDVSSYQGPIDWKAVKTSGVDFAIIRALTWSNSAGYYVIDPYFEYNVRNAKANGIKVGAYLFSYAFNTAEVTEEVNFFHNSTQMQALRRDNIQFDFPVFIDFEWNRILEHTDYNTRTEIVRIGMILLEKYGYHPGFYSSHNWAQNHYDAAGLARQGYDFWVARYPANPNLAAGTSPWLGYQAQMWQYASDGAVSGIGGNVDMNICYKDYGSAGGSSGSEVSLGLTVYDVNTSKVASGTVEDILAQIVMNEVGAMNHAEVYKAQAVAAYSWILYQQAHGNAIPSVGLRSPSAAVRAAVSEVAGKALYYDGAVANAAYGSASAGKTNTARNMWGLELPYLNTPVDSPEGEWRGRQNSISAATMQGNLAKIVGADTVNATPHAQWITDPAFDANGYLTSIKVCGQTVGGGRFYENCWGLYSPKFTFSYDANSDSWAFTTDGNGHCVGMSQYGALTYANQGWNYQQILAHYYPGTALQ